MHGRWIVCGVCLTLVAAPRAVFAQAPNLRAELQAIGALQPDGTVVAQINDEKIDAAEVNQLIKRAVRGQQVSKDDLTRLQATALETVIAKRLVTKFLDSQKITVTDAEVAATIQAIKNQLTTQKRTYEEYLSATGMTEPALRKDKAWDLRWAKFCQSVLNEAELQKFFDAHRADYDGRELHVSHILFRADRPQPLDQEAAEALQKKAEQVKAEIESGKMSFTDAATKYSAGPSRRQGGDLGFIPRAGVMDNAFSKAAFSLEKDKISPPVGSAFGVHLIRWTEARPGTKTLKDVQAELQQAAVQDLFQRIADQVRSDLKVEYTGEIPHIDPATKKLVVPERKAIADKGDAKAGDGKSEVTKPDEKKSGDDKTTDAAKPK